MAFKFMTARSERPIKREISLVRPPEAMRPREERVVVARGSMEYSALSQPLLDSLA